MAPCDGRPVNWFQSVQSFKRFSRDLFGAFGHDGIGQIGSETTFNSGDIAGILMIAVQVLERRTAGSNKSSACLTSGGTSLFLRFKTAASRIAKASSTVSGP